MDAVDNEVACAIALVSDLVENDAERLGAAEDDGDRRRRVGECRAGGDGRAAAGFERLRAAGAGPRCHGQHGLARGHGDGLRRAAVDAELDRVRVLGVGVDELQRH